MKYPKPKYGRILRGSEKPVVDGQRYHYNGHLIVEGEAYYQFEPPIYGKSGSIRSCWIVSERGKTWMVMDGDIEEVEDEIESIYPSIDTSSSSSSEEIEPVKTSRRIDIQLDTKISIPRSKRRIGIQRRK